MSDLDGLLSLKRSKNGYNICENCGSETIFFNSFHCRLCVACQNMSLDRSFTLCNKLIDQEKRKLQNEAGLRAELEARIAKTLPLRRKTDKEILNEWETE